MGERRRRIDKVLDPEFLVDLPEWPLDELRRRQTECLEVETEVSYIRRMTQARIEMDAVILPTGKVLAILPSGCGLIAPALLIV